MFYKGRAPKGERTDWVMHEYCVKGNELDGPQVILTIFINNSQQCELHIFITQHAQA